MSFRRPEEQARLDDLVRDAAAGHGGALRVVGERGMGKTAALDYAVRQAAGFRVLRMRAVAAERDLPYAGLHLLCATLPVDGPLSAAFGPDRPGAAVVGPALLDLLAGIARTEPVCVAVDDAHWLDDATAEVLTFVAARAGDHALAILLAGPAGGPIPEMRLRPLCGEEVSGLFADALPGPIDRLVAERVLAESQGNPRALAEALDGLTRLAGGFRIPAPRRLAGHGCTERAARLAPVEGRLLLAAAAEPTGDRTLFGKLAADLGADLAALTGNGLLVVGDRVTFTCPELRCVVYHAAAPDERRLIHRRLADITGDDPARRAWHLGLASTGHDDRLADELEAHAGVMRSRGGAAARAAFLEMAALLTGEPARRADRALAAAAAKHDSGDLAAAQRMLARVETEPHDAARCALRSWYQARIETAVRPGDGSALLGAARRLRRLDPVSAREAYLEVLLTGLVGAPLAGAPLAGAPLAGAPLAGAPLVREAASEALAVTAGHREHPADLLLYGLAVRITDGIAASMRPLRAAITAFHQRPADARAARWLGPAALIAADLFQEQAWRDLTRRSDGAYRQPRSGAAAASHNAAGQYDSAILAARDAVRPDHPGFAAQALAELVEAGVRAGDLDLAAAARARLAERTKPAGTDWALGVQAMADALLSGDEASYREAIDRLRRTGIRAQLARAELLYGEWLRRRNRRVDARAQLRSAGDHFTALGATAFAARAHRELLATGEAARKRTVESMRQLTPQEIRVASLARDGLTNAEIAARLFVSPRTVEYHLHKAFAKLGIKSRAKLHAVRGLD